MDKIESSSPAAMDHQQIAMSYVAMSNVSIIPTEILQSNEKRVDRAPLGRKLQASRRPVYCNTNTQIQRNTLRAQKSVVLLNATITSIATRACVPDYLLDSLLSISYFGLFFSLLAFSFRPLGACIKIARLFFWIV